MKVLVVSHFFPPETGAPQARLSETIAAWAKRGAAVQVLTGFPNHPSGVVRDGYRGRIRMSEHGQGHRVVRTWLFTSPRRSFATTTLSHLSFMVSGLLLGWRKVEKPDVVIVSSPTFFSIFTAWVYSRRFRVPLVVEVRDLWPGVFVELGVLSNRAVIRILEAIELLAYRVASHVVVVTRGFEANLVQRGVPPEKVTVITNGVDTEAFYPASPKAMVREELGAREDQPLVLYLGAHGISQGLEIIVDTAPLLPDAQFTLVGDGTRRSELMTRGKDAPNLRFLLPVSRDRVVEMLNAADILVAPLRDIDAFETFIPSKLFEFLASGTPVIGALRGEAAAILSEAGGEVVAPGSAQQLSEAVQALIDDPVRRQSMAHAGRAHVKAHFDRNALADRYYDLLIATIQTPVRAGDLECGQAIS